MKSPNLRIIGLGVGLLIALVLPLIVYPVLATDIVLWGLAAVALDLLLGFAGLLSFGHAVFWGSAAYATGVAAARWNLPLPLAILFGILIAVLLAIPIGYMSVRRVGIYFAMVTLAFAQMIFYLVNQWRDVTGGENGLQGIPRNFFGSTITDPTVFYYIALTLVLLGLGVAYRIIHSPFGHVLMAIRDNEPRARALGYATNRYKLLAFVLSAGLSGLAGSLFGLSHGFVALEVVHWTTSGTLVMMAILGGIGTLWGGMIGAALVLLLRDWLSSWTDAWGVVTGAIFVLVILSFRRGILGSLLQARMFRSSNSQATPSPAEVVDVESTLPR